MYVRNSKSPEKQRQNPVNGYILSKAGSWEPSKYSVVSTNKMLGRSLRRSVSKWKPFAERTATLSQSRCCRQNPLGQEPWIRHWIRASGIVYLVDSVCLIGPSSEMRIRSVDASPCRAWSVKRFGNELSIWKRVNARVCVFSLRRAAGGSLPN